jgi:hypothetical protein
MAQRPVLVQSPVVHRNKICGYQPKSTQKENLKPTQFNLVAGTANLWDRHIEEKSMRMFLLRCTAAVSFAATLLMTSSSANAVFWRGITAPTNIDIHGWPIIKESFQSPCQWIRLSGGYWVRQCVR